MGRWASALTRPGSASGRARGVGAALGRELGMSSLFGDLDIGALKVERCAVCADAILL